MNVNLRDATENDFNFVFELNKTNMRKYVEETRVWDDEKEKKEMKQHFTPGLDKIITVDGKDVGVWRVVEKGKALDLAHIEILPEYQGKGIGTQLIKDLVSQGKQVILQVRKNNPALKLYQKLGFKIIVENKLKYFMSTSK
ncbi:MAG: GCN5-related N-acetyltransferase [Candidatus Nomurabacteria bacterium]|nr:GCN5-related N-acetyltransferase [Candidatus Nomurabacteria bacterium]